MATCMIKILLLLQFSIDAEAHGSMYEPPSRNSRGLSLLAPTCAGGACQWYSQGSSIGCASASQRHDAAPDCSDLAEPRLQWGQDDELLQFHTDGHGSNTTYFPWRYPGAAPVVDSCGMTGGGFPPLGQLDPPPGAPSGARGSRVAKLLEQTVWTAGSTVEVAWGIAANHGGGYQYRLCPANQELTEECFQKRPLEFVGDRQWIQFGNGFDTKQRHEIRAQRIGGEKVKPAYSTWTRNPIPGCKINGARDRKPCLGPTFPPPLADRMFKYGGGSAPGIFGYGGGHCMGNQSRDPDVKCTDKEYGDACFDFGIVDKVKVPDDLPPGDYVIGFRWDAEQTKQIWNSCGDVTVNAKGPMTKPFSPQKGCTACCVEGGICANCTNCLDDKTGDCAYCWKPLKWWDGGQFWSPRSSSVQCLGYEAEDGHAPDWKPGQPISLWSPGCQRCWSEGDGCAMHVRELTDSTISAVEASEWWKSPGVIALVGILTVLPMLYGLLAFRRKAGSLRECHCYKLLR